MGYGSDASADGNRDRMTNKERIKALILNQPIDRVPFISFFLGYLAVSSGISLHDFFSRPEVAFRAGLETMEKHSWAGIRPAYDWADHGAWEFGGRIAWPKNDRNMTPYTPEPLVSSPDEVERLPNPDPTETEIREALTGNYCRCTGWVKPVEAIIAAAAVMREEPA